jgi:hypothetical protein
MQRMRVRPVLLSVVLIAWLALFHYESTRYNYLGPWLGQRLPKLPLLFPPAGWIMFYRIEPHFGTAEVYRVQGGQAQPMDAHVIFRTRAVGYDNLRRNVVLNVLHESQAQPFCAYLRRRFPQEEAFVVAYKQYPNLIDNPQQVQRRALYRCQ